MSHPSHPASTLFNTNKGLLAVFSVVTVAFIFASIHTITQDRVSMMALGGGQGSNRLPKPVPQQQFKRLDDLKYLQNNGVDNNDDNEKDFDIDESNDDVERDERNLEKAENVVLEKEDNLSEEQKNREGVTSRKFEANLSEKNKEKTKQMAVAEEKEIESSKENSRTSSEKSNIEKETKGKNAIENISPKAKSISAQTLATILDEKLRVINIKNRSQGRTCSNKFLRANSCDNNTCLQTTLPMDTRSRIKQLVDRGSLKLTDYYHAVLREMAEKVRGRYDVIILTTASSNHYMESQALLKNLHDNIFPVLKNFSLVFYDIGLTDTERNMMERYCKCQVVNFPFDKLPSFVQRLKCYSWKPVMIKAHATQANVVIWVDASIRFHKNIADDFLRLIEVTKTRGVQIAGSNVESSFRTWSSMYHFFGDEPCAYLGLSQAKATVGMYHNELFVDRVILEPWVACALNKDCMCPDRNAGCEKSKIMENKYYSEKGPIQYDMCHRFDQSSISIILHKLYQGYFRWVMIDITPYLVIARDTTLNYFSELIE